MHGEPHLTSLGKQVKDNFYIFIEEMDFHSTLSPSKNRKRCCSTIIESESFPSRVAYNQIRKFRLGVSCNFLFTCVKYFKVGLFLLE